MRQQISGTYSEMKGAGFLCINKLDVAFGATYCNGLIDRIVMCSEGLVYEGGNSHERSNIPEEAKAQMLRHGAAEDETEEACIF